MSHWRVWVVVAAMTIWMWPASVKAQERDRPTVDLHVTASHISVEEFEELVPALKQFNLPRSLKIDELAVEGPRNDLKLRVAIDSPSGAIRGSLEVNTAATTRVHGTLQLDDANVAAVFEQPALPAEFTGNVDFDIKSSGPQGRKRLAGTYRFDSRRIVASGFAMESVRASGRVDGDRITVDSRGHAYGAQVSAKGYLQLGSRERPVTYELAGRAEGLDLRRLPARLTVPDLETRLNLAYTLSGSGSTVNGQLELDPSLVSGAKVADGTNARFTWGGQLQQYEASGSVAGLDLARLGREASVSLLQQPRFAGQLSGRFTVTGHGSELNALTLDLSDARVFSGSLSGFHASLTWGEGTLHYELDGAFRDVAPAQLLDQPRPTGQITGRLTTKGDIPRNGYELQWKEGSIDGHATLDRSTLEDVSIATLEVVGRVANGVATLDRLDATGDARLHAAGRLVFDNEGESDLEYHVEASSLAALRRRWSWLPEGSVLLDGKLTGPSAAPRFAGILNGSSLRAGSISALTSKTSYDVTIPDFDVARIQLQAQTTASVVNIGRVMLPSIDGRWSYGADGLGFEAHTSDRARVLDIAGTLRVVEGQQELRLSRLTLSANQAGWSLAPFTEAVVRVTDGQVEVVQPFTLVAPDQKIVISGHLGESSQGPLVARFENVDLAVLAPWVNWPYVAGRLNATLDMTGALDAPRIKAAFEVQSGAIRQYRYEKLTGTAQYENGGLRLDARVNQDASTSITIVGSVPIEAAGSQKNSKPGELDLTVRSDTISLAAIQGVTSYLTNVAGTARLDVHVAGSPSDPIIVGTVEIKGGAFDVPAIGTRYSGLDTTIRFEPRGILLSDFVLQDHDKHTIVVSGSLPLFGLGQGKAAIDVLVNDAHVLDNDLGRLEVVGVMRITADPAWLVTASLEIRDGLLRVDRWLERRPRPVPARIEGVVPVATAPSDSPGLLADLPVSLDVRLNTEGLVLRGRNLRRNSPLSLGLGNVNITTEGQLRFTKQGNEAVQVVGDLQMVRGTYAFQGREFEIDRGGLVRFTGGEELNPILNISGRRVITGVEAQVKVTGTLREPRLALSSQPPLDEADILSLVVFDQPVSTLGTTQQFSLAQRGAVLAGGALTSEFSETLSEALDIDLFDLQVATTEAGVGGLLTVGERLGDRVFVKARQLFGPDSPTEVLLEYDISKHWRLQTSIADDRARSRTYRRPAEKGSIDLKFSIRY